MPETMIPVVLGALLTISASAPRERIRFDANWRFFRQPIPTGASRLRPFKWEWKLAQVNTLDVPELPADLNSGEWIPTQVGTNVLKPRQYGWFRTELGGDPLGAEKVLDFESIDEDASIYLNGKHLTTHIGFGTQFEVPVRTAWHAGGPNALVVLVKNVAQSGGINGGVNLVTPESEVIPPEAASDFDDSKWRTVHLPHDYVIEGTFDPNGDNSHGSLPKPVGIYRKTFTPPASMRGKSVWLEFEGVYRNADVYLNGERLGHQNSGYAGFRFDLSKRLDYGHPNVLAVRVDPRKNEGWWYEGGGIYRHVWLTVTDPAHIAPDGIFVKSEIEGGDARVTAKVTVEWDGKSQPTQLVSEFIDPHGKVIGSEISVLDSGRPMRLSQDHFPDVPDNRWASEVTSNLQVSNPMLWSIEHPNLYRYVARLYRGNKLVDEAETTFGIRSIRWDKDLGFFLNGKPLKLQGTSNHQDHAGVGVAIPDSLFEWRVKRLKEMGCNAYRTAHNPVAPAMLDACDRLGMLILDETRHFGDATASKSAPGTKADDLSDLKSQVLRDRNHPCVIAWSLYNEEPLQGTEEGAAIFKKMRAAVDELDGTRLCTGATNYGFDHGVIDATQLFGINYGPGQYDGIRAKHPNLPLFGSETGSAVSTRGIYANDPVKGYVGAYDVNKASFGNTAEEAWKAVATRPWMAGAFVWTGFDYKGEPTPYGWPCINSAFGIIDIAGFPKDTFWYYKAWWGDQPVVHLLPHWNWDAGTIKVWAHSNADQVELFLNGHSLGTREVPHLGHVEWDVPYTPGVLEARGTKNGKVVATDRIETTGPPAALRLKTDRKKIFADHEDVALVEVEVVDAKGRVVPTASNLMQFSVEGAGAIGGVGNGDPSDHDPDKADHRKAFNGRCMVLVQSNGGKGKIVLRVTSPGLAGADLTLTASGGVISQ